MPHTQTRLEAVRAYERQESIKIPVGDRPLFHLTPLVGWMNDPNGFCYYQDAYHMFYQYHPYNTVWGPMHWGHAVSTDLLHWSYQPTALAPDTVQDSAGCFSGSAVPLKDGRLLLLYTGVQPASTEHPELQTQCVAIGDGVNFTKVPQNPVMADAELPPEYSRIDFRDPKLWWDEEEEKFYCVVGNRHPERQGTILMFESEDALKWSFVTELDSTNNEYGRMWECPDFFELDGVQLLLTSPQEMQATTDGEFHAGYGTVAVLGSYDKHSHTFTRSAIQPIDYGLDFYAPQTTLAPDGRRIMIGWMENWEACGGRPRRHKWFGRMSLPREISVKNGRLYQMPVRELSSLWQTNTRLGGLTINGEASFAQICGRCIDMTITLDVAASPNCRRFAVRLAQNDRLFTEIRCELTHNELVFDRSRGGSHRDIPHTRHIKAAPKDGVLRLRIVMDSESIELFVNDGERALSALIPDTASDADRVTFYSDAPLCMDVEHHVLK